ncbi:hypothetical protein BOTBODRAFT_35427 [Botryobasidium botryosum FD-172 SS1]|uniref:CFEM domain-containing protein n=1 Tax=Botryobasidium botryosum (strain FD-172 SS1) TaxID=930990 RepID=A0A067MHJ7_BOTB1|nr:hypothetical protein BOTBODRAFT_35427 [Botryobasidium botryosum FD-172 SS1]
MRFSLVSLFFALAALAAARPSDAGYDCVTKTCAEYVGCGDNNKQCICNDPTHRYAMRQCIASGNCNNGQSAAQNRQAYNSYCGRN